MIEVKYKKLCLNCKGEILTPRLFSFGVCDNCLSNKNPKSWDSLFKILEENKKLNCFERIYKEKKEFQEFCNFFQLLTKNPPTFLQQTFAKRIIMKKSFSILAPPGVGKTMFGLVFSLFLAQKGKKSYIIVPTTLLIEQIKEKIDNFSLQLKNSPRCIFYSSNLSSKEKKAALERIKDGNFEILVTTERFLGKNFQIIEGQVFDFVFVDDVDAFLKSPKNIDKILKILGFSEQIISLSFELLNLRKALKWQRKDKKLLKQIKKIEDLILKEKQGKQKGILVVSGATLKAKRTKKIKLFELLLDFEVGSKSEILRNVKDVYLILRDKLEEKILEILRKFGGGCLILVASPLGKPFLHFLNNFLREKGIQSEIYDPKKENTLEKFKNGEIFCLLGMSTFKSPLLRGLDLPERIRYVIFAGVPRIEIKLTSEHFLPSNLLIILKNLSSFFKDQKTLEKIVSDLKKIALIPKELQKKIKESIETGKELGGFENFAKETILRAQNFLKKEITPEIIEKIEKSKEISLKNRGETWYLVVPDVVAYLQGSGRTSRLFVGGISRGASFLIVDDEKSFFGLKERLRFIDEDIEFKEYREKSILSWFRKIDEDRKKIRSLILGELKLKRHKELLRTVLVLVESPTKAKTISKFFGKPAKRKFDNFVVYEASLGNFLLNIFATMGHLFDLTIGEGFHGVEKKNGEFLPIYDFIKICKDCKYQFTGFERCPKCGSENIFSKEKIVEILRHLAKEVNYIFLATDPDIEGEKIAFDLCCALFSLNKNIHRLEFHEITKKAFLEALRKRREINLQLVKAALLRRIEDRWLGFELSQKLWERFKNKNLSAGRVQTPVLGWIIERTKKAREKKKILKVILENNLSFSFEEPKEFFSLKTQKVKIEEIERKKKIIFPPPPFTTDTLLKESSSFLKFSAKRTMEIAQELFEIGLITYHRTDSTTVSQTGIQIAKNFILENFPNLFSPRAWKKEGAHECIRPTRAISSQKIKELIGLGILRFQRKLNWEHFALYDLIFRRFIASQMKEISVLYQKLKVSLLENEIILENPIQILEQGFNQILFFGVKKEILPGEYSIKDWKILYFPKETLFTQGGVIAQMKEKGIGRPSTYAKIIEVLLERRYVKERKNKISSTPLGYKIYQFLRENFYQFVSEETTRRLEEVLDKIEEGKEDYQKILRELFEEMMKIKNFKIDSVSPKVS